MNSSDTDSKSGGGFYDAVYSSNHPSNYGGDTGNPQWQQRISALTGKTEAWLDATGLARNSDAKVLEIGCGLAYLNRIHPGWHGLDYSKTAVERVKARDGEDTRIHAGDVQALPFPDMYFDGVYSHAALEHVSDPHKAFLEIDRVLCRGGSALIAPAWNCRPWTVKKLEQRPYASLGFRERIEKFLIPLRENLVFRAVVALPRRLYNEFRLLSGKPTHLEYKALVPRWDLIEKYGHESDDDALANMDSHSAMCFFLSRGYEVLSHPGLLRRLTARGEAIVVRKW